MTSATPITLTPGGRIDPARPFVPVRIAVLTVSDTRDEESDTSGHVLADRITGAGHVLADKAIVRDDVDEIRARILAWVDSGQVDAVISTGGLIIWPFMLGFSGTPSVFEARILRTTSMPLTTVPKAAKPWLSPLPPGLASR